MLGELEVGLINLAVEATFHTILCLRQVYPSQVFVRRRKYDAPVFQSRSPSLNEYLASCVKSIGQELLVVSHSDPYGLGQLFIIYGSGQRSLRCSCYQG